MVDAKILARLRDGGIYVNTARTWATDQEALLAELRKGRIRAALDVFEEEPLPTDSPFRGLGDHVILTPHAATCTVQVRRRIGEAITEDLRRFLSGEDPRFRVRKEMLATMA